MRTTLIYGNKLSVLGIGGSAGGDKFIGNWDASTNTPTLADGTGDEGNWYNVSVAGTQDLGSGPITYTVGDEVKYNGTIWVKLDRASDSWSKTAADEISPAIDGDKVNLRTGALRDANSSADVPLSSATDPALLTIKKNLLGAINEVLASIPPAFWTDTLADLIPANTRNLRVAENQSYFIGKDLATLDQSQTAGSNYSTLSDLWQSVTQGLTGNLIQVDLEFIVSPTPADTVIRIYAGEGKGGTLLSTVPATSYATGWQSIVLPTPPYLQSGTVFTIGATASGPINWRFNISGGYAGGRFSMSATADAYFRTYVLQTLYAAWKEGVAVVDIFKAIAQNNSGSSLFKIYNDAPGQITELELNEGATKVIEFSNDPDEAIDLDKKLWTIAAIMKHIASSKNWLDAVINRIDFTTAEPVSPTVGDRYIDTVTGTGSVTPQTFTINYIYEWNGTDYTETVPEEGDALWDETADEYLSFNGTAWVPFDDIISITDLNKYVSVSVNGSSSFSAKNVDKPITSLITAMSKAAAFPGTFTQPAIIDVLDGGGYILGASGITIPSFAYLRMAGAFYNGSDVKLSDDSACYIRTHSAATVGYQKASGTGTAYVEVGTYYVGVAEGIRCSAGRIDFNAKDVNITAGNLVAQLCSGDLNIDVSGKVTVTSTGSVTEHDSNGRVNLRLNDVSSAADGFNFQGGAGWNTVTANSVRCSGYAFNVPTPGKYVVAHVGELQEVTASDLTYANYVFGTYRRTGHRLDGYRRVGNMTGIALETPMLRVGKSQTFTNLGTTLVTVATPIVKGTSYKIILEIVGGRINIFNIDVAYNSVVPEILSTFVGGGATYSAPMGTITYLNTAGQDRYTINFLGGGVSYGFYITRSTGVATLSASGATVGNTILRLVPIGGV